MTKRINYRKIWEEHNKKSIPKGYHIHHIDGDKSNNSPYNLICVSAKEHYEIHFNRGDVVALNGKLIQGASEAGKIGGSRGKGKKKNSPKWTEERLKNHRISMSKLRGRKDSTETIENKRLATMGEKNGMWSKNHTQESIKQMSDTKKYKHQHGLYGDVYKRPQLNETKDKISISKKQFHENGGESGFANVYSIYSADGNIIANRITKRIIKNILNITERQFQTLKTYSMRYPNKLHPKLNVILKNEGKLYA